MHMNCILKCAYNVEDLVLSLMITSADTVSGLKKSLPRLKGVKRLGLLGYSGYTALPSNRAAVNLAATIAECVQQTWSSMHTCYCGWAWQSSGATTLSIIRDALQTSPTLNSLHLKASYILGGGRFFESLLTFEALSIVNIASISERPISLHEQEDLFKAIPELRELVVFESAAAAEEPERSVPAVSLTADAFTPLENASESVQEAIWSRVLHFAAEADHVYSDADLQPGSPSRTFKTKSENTVSLFQMRMQLAKVSSRFQRLTREFVFRDVELQSPKALICFATHLLNDPTIGATVHTMVINRSDQKEEAGAAAQSTIGPRLLQALMTTHPSTEDLIARGQEADEADHIIEQHVKSEAQRGTTVHQVIARTGRHSMRILTWHLASEYIFSQVPNLVKLTCAWNRGPNRYKVNPLSGLYLPFWREITKLDGKKLQSLDVHPRTIANRDVDLSKFTKLKFLAIRSPHVARFACEDVDSVGLTGPKIAIPIEELTYENCFGWQGAHIPDAMILRPLLGAMHSFPLVKRLDIKLLHIPDVGSCARKFLEKLLQRCGKTLCELRFSGALKTCVDLNVFNNCPSLQLLTIQGKAYDPLKVEDLARLFTSPRRHVSLAKIHFASDVYYGSVSGLHDVRNAAVISFSAFPALKELQVDNCVWPHNERQLKKGPDKWVETSERLLKDFGIKLTDKSGAHWIPRLKEVVKRRGA